MLAPFEPGTTRYIYQMRSVPAVNRNCHVESATRAWYRYAMSLTNGKNSIKNLAIVYILFNLGYFSNDSTGSHSSTASEQQKSKTLHKK